MMYYHQLNGRLVSCEQLQSEFQKHTKKMDSILPQMWKKIIELEAEVAQLKGQVSTGIDNQETSAPSSKNPLKGLPSTVASTIRHAVQTQAKALLGVSEIRETTEGSSSARILILPPPHSAEGVEQRFSDGHLLFNPDWAKTKNDSYNKRYISAVIKSVKDQAQVRTILSSSSLLIFNPKVFNQDGTITLDEKYHTDSKYIRYAMEQFFLTLCQKYREQMNAEAAAKKLKKREVNRLAGRKRLKHERRITSLKAFQLRHNIQEDLTYLVDPGYMSAEEESHGNVSDDIWVAEAALHRSKGQISFEIVCTPWRAEKVRIIIFQACDNVSHTSLQLVRFFYALDKIGFSPDANEPAAKKNKPGYARFHGFAENASLSWPKRANTSNLVPRYIVDEDWLCKPENLHLLLDDSPEPQAWTDLEIDDTEIENQDLQALCKWKAEREASAAE
jgi:cell division septum initiation protein DivIVA